MPEGPYTPNLEEDRPSDTETVPANWRASLSKILATPSLRKMLRAVSWLLALGLLVVLVWVFIPVLWNTFVVKSTDSGAPLVDAQKTQTPIQPASYQPTSQPQEEQSESSDTLVIRTPTAPVPHSEVHEASPKQLVVLGPGEIVNIIIGSGRRMVVQPGRDERLNIWVNGFPLGTPVSNWNIEKEIRSVIVENPTEDIIELKMEWLQANPKPIP